MTTAFPPLVVRVLPEELIRLRAVERRRRKTAASLSILLGALVVALAAGLAWLISATSAAPVAWIAPVVFVAIGAFCIVTGTRARRSIAERGDYWTGADTPEEAFTLSEEGAVFALPTGVDLGVPSGTVSVPWASIVKVSTRSRVLVFTVARGVLPAGMRNTARYGLPVLDTDAATVHAAVRALRGAAHTTSR